MKLDRIRSSRGFKLAGIAAVALIAIAVFASAAQACSYPAGSKVFSAWGDNNSYVLAPDGGFEGGASGWSLTGGAAVVDGNESYQLNGAGDTKSLSLPAGSAAVSPPICMALDTPSFRLMAQNAGSPSSRLRVEAVYSLLGLVRTKVVSNISSGQSWAPTQSVSTVLGLSTIVGTVIPSSIEIRITPLDSAGRWQVDDLYVDPFARY